MAPLHNLNYLIYMNVGSYIGRILSEYYLLELTNGKIMRNLFLCVFFGKTFLIFPVQGAYIIKTVQTPWYYKIFLAGLET